MVMISIHKLLEIRGRLATESNEGDVDVNSDDDQRELSEDQIQEGERFGEDGAVLVLIARDSFNKTGAGSTR